MKIKIEEFITLCRTCSENLFYTSRINTTFYIFVSHEYFVMCWHYHKMSKTSKIDYKFEIVNIVDQE